MENEIWFEFSPRYFVSNLLRFKSVIFVSKRKNITVNEIKHTILKPYTGKKFVYPVLCISGKLLTVHRIVAKQFVPNPENKPWVNHINGNKLDYRPVNLEWCTPKENAVHADKNGLFVYCYGSKNINAKLTESQVLDIRRLVIEGKHPKEIAKKYCVKKSVIYNIHARRCWKHI